MTQTDTDWPLPEDQNAYMAFCNLRLLAEKSPAMAFEQFKTLIREAEVRGEQCGRIAGLREALMVCQYGQRTGLKCIDRINARIAELEAAK